MDVFVSTSKVAEFLKKKDRTKTKEEWAEIIGCGRNTIYKYTRKNERVAVKGRVGRKGSFLAKLCAKLGGRHEDFIVGESGGPPIYRNRTPMIKELPSIFGCWMFEGKDCPIEALGVEELYSYKGVLEIYPVGSEVLLDGEMLIIPHPDNKIDVGPHISQFVSRGVFRQDVRWLLSTFEQRGVEDVEGEKIVSFANYGTMNVRFNFDSRRAAGNFMAIRPDDPNQYLTGEVHYFRIDSQAEFDERMDELRSGTIQCPG